MFYSVFAKTSRQTLVRRDFCTSCQKLSKSLVLANGRDHYEVLEVPHDATLTEIREAFFKKVKVCHPDVSSSPESREEFIRIRESYKVLSDYKSRIVYDHEYSVTPRPARVQMSKEQQDLVDLKKMEDQEMFLMTKHSFTGSPKRWLKEDELGTLKSPINLCRDLDRVRSKIDEKLEEERQQRKEILETFSLRLKQKYPDDQIVMFKTLSSGILVILLLIVSLRLQKSKSKEVITT